MRTKRSANHKRGIAVTFVAVMLAAMAQPTLAQGPTDTTVGVLNGSDPCPVGAPLRTYSVTSLPIPISYNNWGDLDLQGRLFVAEQDRDALLEDVGDKLSVAGLGEMAAPLQAMRAAFAAHDTQAAVLAAADLVAAAGEAGASTPPRDRVEPSELAAPLVLRAHVGDCVVVELLNVAPEPTSFHVHAVATAPGGGAAVGLEEPDLARPGETRSYRMWIPLMPGMEGAHFVHSHADPRAQTRHGMFGAVVAEPPGTLWLSTKDGQTPAPTGLEAMIVSSTGSDFREFVQIYHDEMELVNWTLRPLPVLSPFGEYGPGTKGINMRSEPFMDRFEYHDQEMIKGNLARGHDKSQSYGSYTYGDPALVMQRSYLGDPVKFRYINAGPGQHHIHHLHGGGIRWRSTPLAEPSQFDIGLTKVNPVQQSDSQRLDVQNAAPGESFNLEPEGGSGGVQQSVGDFLYHCHIAEHYLAGMWGFWRVYNTIQPDLAELPDRTGDHLPAVNSTALLGLELPDGTVLDSTNLHAWVQAQLPDRGVPGEEDASVWNWHLDASKDLYFGEPETHLVWPNYKADAPGRLPDGTRPELGFDPNTGKLAYPHLRPHLGARPPFAPNHGPAPFLKETVTEQNPDGLCPAQARQLKYDVVAIQAPVKYNKFDTDVNGQVFVRAEDKAAATLPDAKPTSIVLRANAGDCVKVTLTSEIKEKSSAEFTQGIHTKTNIHIHLVQFDIQASDGVVAGFNYETTLRSLEGSSSATNRFDPSAPVVAKIGADGVRYENGKTIVKIDFAPGNRLKELRTFTDKNNVTKVGSVVGIGLGETTIETARLVSVDWVNKEITLDRILTNAHLAGEFIGYEFVNYAWFPDVDLGVVYFHDHVDGLNTWRRGLFGSLVVEPAGSRWLPPVRADDNVPDDPTSHAVDILPPDGEAYREFVLHFQDRACVVKSGDPDCLDFGFPEMPKRWAEPSAFNLRAEPLHRRNAEHPFWNQAPWGADDPNTTIDERTIPQGDPDTDILLAYPGDNVMVRYLYTGQSASRAVNTFGMTGHRFKQEQWLDGGRTVDAISASVSSQHNLELECGAGGCLKIPGDYMYWATQPEYVDRGAWGLFRVLDPAVDGMPIATLASNQQPVAGSMLAGPADRHYDIAAIETLVRHNPSFDITSTMQLFVPGDQLPNGTPALNPPDPLTMRAVAGEIVEVTLVNRLSGTKLVGMHAGMLSAGPDSQGFNVGRGPDNTVAPNAQRTYRWYADRELGVADIVSLVDPVNDAKRGLVGALVVEPAGATFSAAERFGSSATITVNGKSFREQVLLFASDDAQFQSSTMPYLPDVRGLTLVNFATEPLTRRAGVPVSVPDGPNGIGGADIGGASIHTCQLEPDFCMNTPAEARMPAMALATAGAAPWTPIIEATQGMPLVLRVVGSSGDQLAAVHVDGHMFATDPEMDGCRELLPTCKSNVVSTVTVGPREVRNLWIPEPGMGGAGDYLYRNHRDAFFEAGAWGLLRVAPSS